MSAFFVYGLFDPAQPEAIRYVGAASHLRRPLAHEREARKSLASTHKLNWIRKVGEVGWRILEACDSWEDTLAAERRIIQRLRAVGARLTNANDGGVGGFNPTPETRARLKAANARPEVRARRSASAKAGMKRPDVRARLSAAAKAAWTDPEERARRSTILARPEVKAKHSAAAKAAFARPEVKAKHSAALKAALASPEARARKSAALKGVWTDPEYKARLSAAVKASWARRRAA